jgi:hypothetical protein
MAGGKKEECMHLRGGFSSRARLLRVSQQLTAVALIAVLTAEWILPASAATRSEPRPEPNLVGLPGHVLDALQRATPVAASPGAEAEPLTLTVTLKRADQAGFERYLQDVYDARSPSFRHFLSQAEITARFGPSQKAYDNVLAYLQQNGFTLLQGSANRLTLTARGTRAAAERAFAVRIRDYALHGRGFYANEHEPALPTLIADHVASVSGLSNLASPAAPNWDQTYDGNRAGDCDLLLDILRATRHVGGPGASYLVALELAPLSIFCAAYLFATQSAKDKAAAAYDICKDRLDSLSSADRHACLNQGAKAVDPPPGAPAQKIGLLEFDTFRMSDVADWLALLKKDTTAINRVTVIPVNGGVVNPGPGESEVLLDIDMVIGLTEYIPNTSYAVYVAPPSTSFQQLFNTMINDGVTIISNSWSQCEDQTSLADAQAIDAVLAQAAASGISVFNGSGDSGSKCLDGNPNTVGVPADSPHATAVGGTTPSFGPALTYGSETWWNGAGQVPPGGQGGFGVSSYFSRPSYQNGLTNSATRSVPDVALSADPRIGLSICQADAGGCPTGLLYGGTSAATPAMAALTAVLNTSLGFNIGQANPVLYPLAGTDAFNAVAGFANVGLGSPNIDHIRLRLSRQTVGPATDADSLVWSSALPVATNGSVGYVRVDLYDANLYPVRGKTVTLTANPGSGAVTSPASGVSSPDGSVVFTVSDATIEDATFTAVDATDGVTLTQTATVSFVAPPAAAASISASPTTVATNSGTTTITVTLQDARGNGTPGKLVTLSQGSGHSIITGPNPAVTDTSGQIRFTATDNVSETVTYTAVDVSDGNLPVPGSASVTFTGGSASCIPALPAAASGFTLTPFATGFLAQNFFFGNINFVGCPGASNPAFDAAGSVFVSDFPNGNLYAFDDTGGAVTNADVLANDGPTFGNLVFGRDGSLYGTHFSPSNIVQIDPASGAVVRTVASGFTCPAGLAVDPLSGDLFFDDACTGGGTDNPSIWRIHNPSSATPTVTVYATLPATPGGGMAFAPDGTLFAIANSFTSTTQPIVRISGTNLPSPPTVTTIPGITSDDGTIAIGAAQANGAAKALIIHTGGVLELVDITTSPFTATALATGTIGAGVIGPDGCLYANAHDRILKLTPSAGGCGFISTNPSPTLTLAPSSVSPNPAQGTTTAFTATLRNVSQPQGTPITFLVSGANSLVKMVRADSNGQATFSYSGVFTGTDKIVAKATLASESPNSNLAQVTWAAGRHTTFLTLNPSPTGGTLGQPVTVAASLTDISAAPAIPIATANIMFTLGNSSCAGVTDANGIASCTVIPSAAGLLSLNAAFGGTANYLGSTASVGFNVRAAGGAGGDTTPPIITPQITGTLGNNGWYRSNVGVSWSVTDPESGIASSSGCTPTTLTTDTAGITLTCSATNGVGLSTSASVTIKIDKTPPLIKTFLTPTMLPETGSMMNVYVGGGIADSLSGVNANSVGYSVVDEYGSVQPSGSVALRPNGSFSFPVLLQASRLATDSDGRTYTITVTGQDNAGNQSSTSMIVVVP